MKRKISPFFLIGKSLVILALLSVAQFCYAHNGANFIASDMLASMQSGDKAALLMVHFGTTHDDTRELTINVLNQKAKETFKELEMHESWTSRIVMRRMKAKGIEKLNPVEALEKLKADGYTHIIVQSSNIIEGVEMESLRRDVASMQSAFKDIRIGAPLLYTPKDYKMVIEALTKKKCSEDAVILVGHGTYDPATAQYAMLDYMLKSEGHDKVFVTTVEGYPTFKDAETRVKAMGAKKVLLMPLMFVAGDHAKNDIAADMKEDLEKKGYKVNVLLKGLGENSDIQNLFLDHIRFSLNHKMDDIVEKKKHYATSDDEVGHQH